MGLWLYEYELASSSNSIRYKNVHKRKPSPRLSRDDSTVRRWWSLLRPRHRPDGTGLSSAITAASPGAAPSTRAPDDLAAQHVRYAQRARETVRPSPLAVAIATRQTIHLCTRGYALSAQMSCLQHGYGHRVRSSAHKVRPQILEDDNCPTATFCHAGRACRARRRRA